MRVFVPTSRAPLWLLTASWSTNKIAVNKSFFDEETISNKRAQSNLNRRGGYGQLPFEIKIGKNGQINRLNAGWGVGFEAACKIRTSDGRRMWRRH